MGQKMPVKETTIPLDGDYAGFEFTIRRNLKAADVDRIFEVLGTERNRVQMRETFGRIVRGWNFNDEDGNAIPPPTKETLSEAMGSLPEELIALMIEKASEAITQPPNASSAS